MPAKFVKLLNLPAPGAVGEGGRPPTNGPPKGPAPPRPLTYRVHAGGVVSMLRGPHLYERADAAKFTGVSVQSLSQFLWLTPSTMSARPTGGSWWPARNMI